MSHQLTDEKCSIALSKAELQPCMSQQLYHAISCTAGLVAGQHKYRQGHHAAAASASMRSSGLVPSDGLCIQGVHGELVRLRTS